jgi:N-acetylglucosamine-6-phosphate deacetylase
MTAVVASSTVCLPDGPGDGWLAIDDGIIVEHRRGAAPTAATDLGSLVLAPGLVDLQCNGLGAVDFAAADDSDWHAAQHDLARHGVTSYCPTFVTAPLDRYPALLDSAASARANSGPDEASLVGVHLEGPFLGGAPGAHDRALIRPADRSWLEILLARHPGLVQIVTLAPEADPDHAVTRWLASSGVVVALGHTTASYDDAVAAADAGASVVTHLYNGMTPWHHRAPGLVGAALTDDRLTPTVIADLVHVHPAAVRVAFSATRVATVSDIVATGQDERARDGAARLSDGTLAGAPIPLDRSLANLVAMGIPWPRALESVTAVPAALLGCSDRGTLDDGCRADLVALDPESFNVEHVWLAGVEHVGGAPPLA